MTWLRRLTGATILFSFIQIVLGALVRLTDSGISCPDWPLCYGLLIPTPSGILAQGPMDYTYGQVMSEWIHRLNAAVIVGPLTLIMAVMAWRRRTLVPRLAPLAIASLLVLLVQAGLGGLTVLDRNSPWSVAVHLSAALVFLALLIGIYRAVTPGEAAPRAAKWAMATTALVALAAIASGAMTAKSGAGLACASWPLCNDTLVPDLADPLVQLNVTHRLLALLTFVAVTALILIRTTKRWFLLSDLLLAAQIALGIAVVFVFAGDSLNDQLIVGLSHHALGVLIFATLSARAWAPARA